MADETYDIQLEAEQINTALLQVHNADATPTSASDNMVRSGGVKQSLQTEETARTNADDALDVRVTALETGTLAHAHVICLDNDEDAQSTIPLTTNGFASGVTVDTVTDRVTIVTSGVYRISASARGENVNGSNFQGFLVSVLLNGATVLRPLEYSNSANAAPAIEISGSATTLMDLTAGDYFTLRQSQFGSDGARTETYLDVEQITIS